MGITLPKAMNIKKPMIKSLRVLMGMTFCITALSYELPHSALCPRSNAAWDCGELTHSDLIMKNTVPKNQDYNVVPRTGSAREASWWFPKAALSAERKIPSEKSGVFQPKEIK